MRARSIRVSNVGRLAVFSAILGLAGCARDAGPELLSVHRLDPARASSGDQVTLTGDGFPEGRSARVTFRGDLFRPGADPDRDVRITVPAVPAARDTIMFTLDPAAERRFAGTGDGALHTTFRGDVRVTFQPALTGVTAVSGTLRDVRFDVLPSHPATASDAVGARSLAFIGASGTLDPGARGLVLDAVDPGGRAARAGLAPGDVIVAMDGVSIVSADDLHARGGEHVATLEVERDGRLLPSVPLDVEGLEPRGVSDLGATASAVLFACAALALLATRFGVLFRFMARLVEIRRSRRRQPRRSLAQGIAGALLPPQNEGPALGAAALVLLLSIVVAFLRLALGKSLFSPDLDLTALALGANVALLVTRFLDAGTHDGERWSLTAAFGGAGRTLVCVLPALGALGGAVIASGRFVLAEMMSGQGGTPWNWASMRNPGLFVLFVVLVATTVPETEAREGLHAEGLAAPAVPRRSTTRALLRLAEWSNLWIVSGLAVALFLGGARVPGVSSMAQEASRSLPALGAALFIVKLWGLVLAVGALRFAAGRVAIEDVARLALVYALPLAVAGLVVATGWAAFLDGARSQFAADVFGRTSVALIAAFPVLLGVLSVRARGRTNPVTVNPWL